MPPDRQHRAAALDRMNVAASALIQAMQRGASDAELDLLLAQMERASIEAGVTTGGTA